MAEVVLDKVTKVFPGGVRAVDHFELKVEDKEFLVLVGPSGCGKSTTLRMVAGLEEITEGNIKIGDRVVNNVAPKDRDIAMVFQNYALYPHMTVYDNMAFGLKLRKFKKSEIDTRVKEAADILGITKLLDRRPKALSGGERQRVAVGRAIVRKPRVFLFDEPLSNLDAKLRVQMRVEISQLHSRLQATMIYVTHDQTEAMTMGERIVVMKDGLVQQVADPISLYDRPVNKFVAGFIGTPPMNFFEGRIKAHNGGLVFDQGDGGVTLSIHKSFEDTLAAHRDKTITMGLRPEDIGSSMAEATEGTPCIKARVDVMEPMGAESYIYLTAGTQNFVSRVDSHRRFELGTEVELAVLNSKAHFFDVETEATIA